MWTFRRGQYSPDFEGPLRPSRQLSKSSGREKNQVQKNPRKTSYFDQTCNEFISDWVVMACLGPKPIKVLLRIKFQDGIDKPQKCRSVCFHPTHQQQKRPSTLPSSRMPASPNLSGAMLAVKVQTSPIVLPAKLTSKFATVATMTWPNTWRPTPISRNTPPFLQHQHYHLCLAVLPASTK